MEKVLKICSYKGVKMLEKDKYFNEIKRLVEGNIVEVKYHNYAMEQERLNTYFNVGKVINEAYLENKVKYGNSFLKNMSNELTRLYGKGYDYTNLVRMSQLYNTFRNVGTLSQLFKNLTWSHLYVVLPIKNESKRNYYINLVNQNGLSVRELRKEIKNSI